MTDQPDPAPGVSGIAVDSQRPLRSGQTPRRLAVWFYHADRADEVAWVWHDAQHVPSVGDFVVDDATAHAIYAVSARGWLHQARCNITLRPSVDQAAVS